MFFGCKFEGGRPYDKLFRHNSNTKYAHHVFCQFTQELWGNGTAVSYLYRAYQKRLRMTNQQQLTQARTQLAGIYNKQIFNVPLARMFRTYFDRLRKHSLTAPLSKF